MARIVESYMSSRATSCLLTWSIDQHRAAKQALKLAVAGRIFASLALASVEWLLVDHDGKQPLPARASARC